MAKRRRPIALFGPPGVGKSTIVRVALEQGLFAIDAEGDPLRHQRLWSHWLPYTITGTADLQPEAFPKEWFWRVLLLPEPGLYALRREERDAVLPHKSGQGDWYHAFKQARSRFDHVYNNWERDPRTTLKRLLFHMSRPLR